MRIKKTRKVENPKKRNINPQTQSSLKIESDL